MRLYLKRRIIPDNPFQVVVRGLSMIKLMTFNIQACRNYYTREFDISLMTKVIENAGADIIGLNEVYGPGENIPAQSDVIADSLRLHSYFGGAIIHRNRPFGNALLAKKRWENIRTIPIPDPPRNSEEYYESRIIIKAEFADFTVLSSHFGLAKSEQQNAVETLLNVIRNTSGPLIVMGDLNMEPYTPTMQPLFSLLQNTLEINIPSFPSGEPKKRIDYIFVSKEFSILDAAILPIVASDHLPHVATVKLK